MAIDPTYEHSPFVQSILDRQKADTETKAAARNTGEMGKQEFLNLLVTQLRYQDPLNPMDDKEFISQMAQFSALEQMQNMNASNTSMKGFAMIGKYVNAQIKDETTGAAQDVEGHVESVIIKGSQTFLMVGGKEIPIDNVTNVSDGYNPLDSNLSAHTGLIGYTVKGAVYDITTGEIVAVNGEVVSLAKGSYEDYAMLDGVKAEVVGISKNGELVEDRDALLEYFKSLDGEEDTEKRQVEVFVTDDSGNRVPIGATLRSYEYDEAYGTVTAVFDQVAVPVTSVATIEKAAPAEDTVSSTLSTLASAVARLADEGHKAGDALADGEEIPVEGETAAGEGIPADGTVPADSTAAVSGDTQPTDGTTAPTDSTAATDAVAPQELTNG